MSKKNLLNEAQVRQFMKLASLQPLTPGFVEGLTETTDEVEELEELRTGRTGALGPAGGAHNPGHGRGQGEAADGSLFEEEEAPPHELEMDAGDDLEDDSLEGDEEAAHDELEADVEMGDEDGGRMVSVDDFLGALETALEGVLGDEVEIDSDEMEDEPEPEAEDEFAPEGDEVVADVEVEDEAELQENDEGADDIVEQITKRVAARILKSALAKK
jgi:hypothetical protein